MVFCASSPGNGIGRQIPVQEAFQHLQIPLLVHQIAPAVTGAGHQQQFLLAISCVISRLGHGPGDEVVGLAVGKEDRQPVPGHGLNGGALLPVKTGQEAAPEIH